MPYDFEDDTELGWTFGYDFGTYDGNEAALRVGDGVGIAVGDASGYLYYAVNRGQLEIIRHTMTYTADAWNGTTASGTLLPLVNASGTLYNQTAPVSALVNAGWTKIDGYNAYQLVSVDGLYQFFDTYAAQDSWLAARRPPMPCGRWAFPSRILRRTSSSSPTPRWTEPSSTKPARTRACSFATSPPPPWPPITA